MEKNNIIMPTLPTEISEKLEIAFNKKNLINKSIFENAIKAAMFDEEPETNDATNK